MIERSARLAVVTALMLPALLAIGCAFAFLLAALSRSHGRDLDGRYANSPLKGWFNSLTDKQGIGCCDTSDGRRVEDADWGTGTDGSYWVVVDGQKLAVPDQALLTQKNRVGTAIVWPYLDPATNEVKIRCFIPGSMS
jgi:hypothetical protein